MKGRNLLIVLLLVCLGCAAQVPIAKNHPLSTQKKAKAVHHWDLLAKDVAKQTSLKFASMSSSSRKKPIYVYAPLEDTVFSKAFRELLITHLVGLGLPVATRLNGGEIGLVCETQLITHRSSRYAHIPGTITTLTAGIAVIRDAFSSSTAMIPAAIGLSALTDWGLGHYAGGATSTELLITTTLTSDRQYLLRKTDLYYIEDGDRNLFATESTELPRIMPFKVVGK